MSVKREILKFISNSRDSTVHLSLPHLHLSPANKVPLESRMDAFHSLAYIYWDAV